MLRKDSALQGKKLQTEMEQLDFNNESIVVLGLGNILHADEGFGVRVAERLYEGFAFPDNTDIVDGGTQGHPLLAHVERADRLLLLDAVDFGLPPGTLIERDSTGIPAYLSAHKMSLHQNSFSEVLALAELRDRLPREIRLVGIQPVDLTFGHSLSEQVVAELDAAVALALAILEHWGSIPRPCMSTEPFQAPGISLKVF